MHDSVEWYSACEFKFGIFSYPYILKNLTNRFLIEKPISVIAISTYLEQYYKSKGLNAIRIPVIMDSSEYVVSSKRDTNSKIKIIYAGQPAKKDYLNECIIAFTKLPTEKRELFEFNIYGVGGGYIRKTFKKELPKEIVAHGRVPRKEVLNALSESDFSMLLRPSKERYAKAGFPTKSVEAMMNGCAMICNISSDLGLYLKDGYNAIVVKDCSSEELNKVLLNVAELSFDEINTLKSNAKMTASNYFDYRKYIDILKDFIDHANDL